MNYVYLLKCADDSFYCGWTNNLEHRLSAHNSGHGARYTRSRLPATLVYYETFETRSEAMRREQAIKKMSHGEKLILIERSCNRNEVQ